MSWDQLITLPVYQLNQAKKMALFNPQLVKLANYHYQHSESYRDIIDFLYQGKLPNNEVPALAVRLFKHQLLKSIATEDIFRITTSSGTTSQKVLATIMKQWLGSKRLPMLIIDHPNVIKNKFSYSARGVGIQGMSLFGYDHTYALNEDMSINIDAVSQFIDKYKDQKIFIFGFTYIIWQYFIQKLKEQNTPLYITDAVLLHSGGWKKLQDKAVSNQTFKSQLNKVLGNVKVHNFYGMVEQTGTVYVECEAGYLHCPIWSDVIVRKKSNLTEEENGIEGIIQVNSLLPTSYPGHALLTEDLGVIVGVDDCQCGKKGKYFQVNGRLAQAEVRGCSDTQS
jgi:hypothetical protein